MTASKKPKLSATDAKVVKAKVKAVLSDKSQNEVAVEVFPNQTPAAAAVSMTRTLKKANVQEALAEALAKHGLAPDSVIAVVGDAMQATKIVTSPTEPDKEVADHGIRLKAAGMAAGFMGLNNKEQSLTTNYNFINVQKQDNQEFFGEN